MRSRSLAVALAILATLQLSRVAFAQADPDAKELASYRLTMATTQKVSQAFHIIAAKMIADPRIQALKKQQQELDALQSKEEPSEADQKRIDELQASIERGENEMDSGDWEGKTLSEMESKIAKTPYVADALNQAGLAPRELAKYFLTMFQASMVYGLQQKGMMKTVPEGVNPENVKFVAEHQQEIQAMTADLQKLGK